MGTESRKDDRCRHGRPAARRATASPSPTLLAPARARSSRAGSRLALRRAVPGLRRRRRVLPGRRHLDVRGGHLRHGRPAALRRRIPTGRPTRSSPHVTLGSRCERCRRSDRRPRGGQGRLQARLRSIPAIATNPLVDSATGTSTTPPPAGAPPPGGRSWPAASTRTPTAQIRTPGTTRTRALRGLPQAGAATAASTACGELDPAAASWRAASWRVDFSK